MNLTITIDDELLKRARIRALEHGTSVNALLRDYLTAYAGDDKEMAARRAFVDAAIAHSAKVDVTPEQVSRGRTWSRDTAYEDRLDRYGR